MKRKPSKVVIIASVILMMINSYFAYILGGGSIGYIIGFVYTLPLVVIVISSIFQTFRSWKLRWIIILNTMLVVLLATFGSLLSISET